MNKEIAQILKTIRDKETVDFPINGLKIQPYSFQQKMILNMYLSPGLVVGDSTGLGKTISAIGLMIHDKNKHDVDKFIVVTNSSAGLQWCDEIKRFSPLEPFFVRSASPNERTKIDSSSKFRYDQYLQWGKKYNVLILYYQILLLDIDFLIKNILEPNKYKFDLILDEATAFKSIDPPTKTFTAVENLVKYSRRNHAMTATPMPNNLIEFYAIFKATTPKLFPFVEAFKFKYCDYIKHRIKIKGREIWVPKLVGYKNLNDFKAAIWPYFYARHKSEVDMFLPKLYQRISYTYLNKNEKEIYYKLEDNLVEKKDEWEEIQALQKITFMQECVDSLELMPDATKGDSSKLEELVRILKEELSEEKVVVFSKFKRMINIISKRLSKENIKSVRITGDETLNEREDNRNSFNASKDINIMLINTAGSTSLNLQSAGYMIVYDLLYSFGQMTQVLGRVHRLGSNFQSVFIIYLLAQGTIDEEVFSTLQDKQTFIEKVLNGVDIDTNTVEKPDFNSSDIIEKIKKRRYKK